MGWIIEKITHIHPRDYRGHLVASELVNVWDEQLALTIKDVTDPIRMTVYDKDRFSGDDKMGNAEIDLRPFVEAHQMELDLQKLPNGCAIKRIRPGRTNCLAEESSITWSNGKIIQDMILRLRNMECGEIEIMLKLTTGPGFSGLGREVYGKDTFTSHDKMGDAQIIIKPFLEVHKLEVCKNFKVEQRSRESCPPEKLLV
ncbi:unnamed protein product [Brassica rapa]|uniref:C2 domain-containing protein n=2 Tax=Brassica campestris TaxID=3711 RepID=A0A8D9HQ17_BRACM|nr:unnamed protein product [Brassica rapa]